MKRANLFHPRVFSDKEWAEGYYKRNAKNIERAGKRFVQLSKISGFENGRILDTGCGFGAVVIEIAKSFDDVEIVGIDLGKPLLKLGELLAEKSRVAGKIYFTEGDVQKLDFEADSFDVVINTFMLHVVDNPVLMLNEIERVAKEQEERRWCEPWRASVGQRGVTNCHLTLQCWGEVVRFQFLILDSVAEQTVILAPGGSRRFPEYQPAPKSVSGPGVCPPPMSSASVTVSISVIFGFVSGPLILFLNSGSSISAGLVPGL